MHPCAQTSQNAPCFGAAAAELAREERELKQSSLTAAPALRRSSDSARMHIRVNKLGWAWSAKHEEDLIGLAAGEVLSCLYVSVNARRVSCD